MNLSLDNNWLIIFTSMIFWLAPVALAINLILKKHKPNAFKKRIAYFYGTLWAIAFVFYGVMFLSRG